MFRILEIVLMPMMLGLYVNIHPLTGYLVISIKKVIIWRSLYQTYLSVVGGKHNAAN